MRPVRRFRVWALCRATVLAVPLLVLAWALVSGGAGPQAPAPPAARHVVLLSLDGARADAVRAAVPPALAARGAVSWTAQTISPSLTLPSHASMLSGVPPAVHGVTFNDWREGQPYFARASIFTQVARSGGQAAAFVHKAKMLMFMPAGSGTTARFLRYPRVGQAEVVDTAARFFAAARPTLLFIHVADPDAVGHAQGWMGEAYLRVIAGIPALIERLLRVLDDAGVADAALVIVTADHGGHGRTHGTNRPEDMTIPWMAFGGAARPGSIQQRVVTYDTAATVLAALGLPVPGDWQGRPVMGALRNP
ncbi:MAG: alkaline phosphatase family protein [Armatimonadota bacterium]|nr:alkaline phosphatase family protein [Armatimonadota bacterium]